MGIIPTFAWKDFLVVNIMINLPQSSVCVPSPFFSVKFPVFIVFKPVRLSIVVPPLTHSVEFATCSLIEDMGISVGIIRLIKFMNTVEGDKTVYHAMGRYAVMVYCIIFYSVLINSYRIIRFRHKRIRRTEIKILVSSIHQCILVETTFHTINLFPANTVGYIFL